MEKPTIPTVVDISKLVEEGHLYDLKMHNESEEDAVARREKDAADAALKRKMSFVLFLFSLATVSTIFLGCLYTVIVGSQEDKKWAVGIITAISSGLIGFLVGQAKK